VAHISYKPAGAMNKTLTQVEKRVLRAGGSLDLGTRQALDGFNLFVKGSL
jgi:hypothetical protein